MSGLRSDILVQPQEIFTASTTQQTDLGAKATDGNGRVFRYVSTGSTTALAAGSLYQATPQASKYNALGIGTFGTGVAVVTTGTTITVVANELAGGWVSVRSGSGSGFLYRIKGHPAATAAAVTLTLEDPLQVAFQQSSTIIDLVPNPYANVVINAATANSVPIGVAVANSATSNFGWVQTRGPASVLVDGTPPVGIQVSASIITAGAVQATRGSTPVIGQMMITGVNAVNNPVFLTME